MGVVENAKEIARLIREIDNIDLYRRILDLQGELLEVVDQNRQLRERVADLEAAASLADELVYEIECYWRVRDGERDGPFCSHCWDDESKLIRLLTAGRANRGPG